MKFALLVALGFAVVCSAQNRDNRREFDVASVHSVKVESGRFPPTTLLRYPARIDYGYVPMIELVRGAYDVPGYRMAWPERLEYFKNGLYSIQATFPAGTTEAQLREMLQRLLEERFALRIHWEKKILPGYEVTVAPGGAKLTRSDYSAPPAILDPNDHTPPMPANRLSIFQALDGRRRITGVVSIPGFLGILTGNVGKPMIDRTSLEGYYDINFAWNGPPVPSRTPGVPGPPGEASIPEGSSTANLFPALEKQLGLKVESVRLDVDVLTIDSVAAAPIEN